ncbi:riboflavin biosynthesis protein RibD [Helicobacter sp. 16-1353]|uniref:bifunctional diaminohydroxyphosphoribosylaminopyrimidine deaminase/5-amino-6-(5-phosphoribosylamino)uracil reductase RibD n=1 Tax=Helicobacter sp. 16-1353 TaxID=2004996 RepID=UPI000DCDFD6F|nr:bifunctional diaminohydroxyphosphoribosylaminopyrimidine deaminase/5-amino-6-(5-phosphoribosylamino)uracil reductase RibD [Helicobacter sp. 16-1353]RAX55128.1 riboflavin biosynthesis protein RibD [Helicobacter sp. 16-1353]
MNNEFYMNLALNYAWESQALSLPNPSVGALILDSNNAIISLESHQIYGQSHAELKALKSAYIKLTNNKELENINNPFEIYDFLIKNHNGIFHNTSIFVTLEPCNHFGKTPSCAELLSILKPKKIFISAPETNNIASGGISTLRKNGISVECGILENMGRDLLFPFLCMCNNKSFSIYKIAQRLNGSFDGGIISSEFSRIYSHKLRNIADRIIISQKTILNDNPLLDSRLINGKSPDIIVIGRENKLHKNLNIFQDSNNRKVEFISNINAIPFDGFNIIEGGAELFGILKNKIDCLLVFISPQIKSGSNFYSDFNGRILHSMKMDKDILLWIQKS